MSIEIIHLRKLLKLLYLPDNRQTSELRRDIWQDRRRESGLGGGGGDFHSPLWFDAGRHAFHIADLHDATAARIEANDGRERLYLMLRDGFLLWWNERRRWTNEPFQPIPAPHARYQLTGTGVIKLEALLAVRDAANVDHFVYPYFAEEPILSDEAARLALWTLCTGLPHIDPNELRILDVIRGQAFSLDRNPLQGNEEEVLRYRYQRLLNRWHELRET